MSARRFEPGKLAVSEIFGPTFQGEGPSIGVLCGFLRLGYCNLQCSWCDTAYTWDWGRYSIDYELSQLPVAEVARRIDAMDVPMLVVSGGEPLLQQAGLLSLFDHLSNDLLIEVETNGTIAPEPLLTDRVTRFNVSPKLAHASMGARRRIRPSALGELADTGKAAFKFVAAAPSDLDELDDIVRDLALPNVYVMPEGRTERELLARMRELAPGVLARKWNLTTRLQVLLWGDQRSV